MAYCELGRREYDRGLLCSDATLRRTQKKVFKLAESLGFVSFPNEEKGKVWCWGDVHGDFVTGVNRYVYEVYVKARCASATVEQPWIVPLTGDLAIVSGRGKQLTMCGPKEADPRLACQQATGKTSNQSRNMYTPAVAGYVDESNVMKYFDKMVNCFREIEARGFCVVGDERHDVFINVLVVADMSYLHKYLRRGGGSHSSTNFCFLCSVNRKYRHEGYPGGCQKCRSKDIVYDKETGAQKCPHHDVCDKAFIEWETARLAYLEQYVKPRIPISSRPYYECKQSLKEQCLLRCSTASEVKQVEKKKSLATLEKWLHGEGRTREGCDLSCNIHTGIRICPFSLVSEDLQLRGVQHADMSEGTQRHALEMLLREEEEYLKLQMYVRDTHFRDLLTESGHRTELHKTIIDVLHCPMRTNEKVLTLLYEEVMQGNHKAETNLKLNELTNSIREVGELGPSFTHKFEKKNTKVLQKMKVPYDQSRKIFSIYKLNGLRDMVNIAVPVSQPKRRDEWNTFLFHYVRVNDKLHSTLEYTVEDIDELEMDCDATYDLLVKSIGGKEHGVTNYFHHLGSGHLLWMVRRYGNLWRFCNEGAEALNNVASKRYNMFNNMGGHKSTCKGESIETCLPFQCMGSWFSRLSMWHIGTAETMFAVDSTPHIVWDPDTCTYIVSPDYVSDDEYDSDWSPIQDVDDCSASESSESGYSAEENDSEDSDDMSWCRLAPKLQTWNRNNLIENKTSKRTKYQLHPLVY